MRLRHAMGWGKKVRRSGAQSEILRRSWRNEKLSCVNIFIYLSSEVWLLDSAVRTRHKTSTDAGLLLLVACFRVTGYWLQHNNGSCVGSQGNIGHNIANNPTL